MPSGKGYFIIPFPDSRSPKQRPKINAQYEEILVNGEPVGYFLRKLSQDVAGTVQERRILIFFPGHGQRVQDDNALIRKLSRLSGFDEVWALDLNPLASGDPMKAKVVPLIVCKHLGNETPFRLTLMGWSHGAAEALLTAENDPGRVEKVIAMCPAGFLNISLPMIIARFTLECVYIFLRSFRSGKVLDVLGLGLSITMGMVKDLFKSGSIRTFLGDIRWAGRRVVGEDYTYDGKVTIILGRKDSLMRPKRILRGYKRGQTGEYTNPVFKQMCFPRARELRVFVTNSDHAGPVVNPEEFLRLGLRTSDVADRHSE